MQSRWKESNGPAKAQKAIPKKNIENREQEKNTVAEKNENSRDGKKWRLKMCQGPWALADLNLKAHDEGEIERGREIER